MKTTRLVVVASWLLAGISASANCWGAIELLVPAYENPAPSNPNGLDMWSRLIATSNSLGSKLNVILNPASGPAPRDNPTANIDPNFISDQAPPYTDYPNFGSAPLLELRRNGADAFGYVATGYGPENMADGNHPGKSLDAVKSEINRYFETAYYRNNGNNGVQSTGIFLDEMSSNVNNLGHYQAIYDHIQAQAQLAGVMAHVVANPGVNVDEAFLEDPNDPSKRAADTLVIFEGSGADYPNFMPESYVTSGKYQADRFAHIIHSEDSFQDMMDHLQQAESQNAGMVYITDDEFEVDANGDLIQDPFDKLAREDFWNKQVATAVPEPGSLLWLSLGVLCFCRRRSRLAA